VTRVAIHGFGRIGRQVFKALWHYHQGDAEVVAIGLSDVADARAAAHLLKYDSNYGRFAPEVRADGDRLLVADRSIPLVAASTPSGLPWGRLGVDVVVDATGAHAGGRLAAGHLEAGAAKAIVAAPSEDADFTLIVGVNDGAYDPAAHHVVSTGSDTTNALAPLLKVIDARFGLVDAMMTAVRAYTNEQKLLDATDGDLRRARSAPTSIVPTTTRASKAIGQVMPHLKGRVSGFAVCVPVPSVSVLELTCRFDPEVDAQALNEAFREAAADGLGRVLAVSDEALVSSDFRGSRYSAVVDLPSTLAIGPLAKVAAWYDNEWGYASRVAEAARIVAGR